VIFALVLGTMLAVGALAFVLQPLFFAAPGADRLARAIRPRTSQREEAVAALREIEFDRETGKLSEADYTELKARYTKQAIEAMRRDASVAAASPAVSREEDEIEAAVRAYRAQRIACAECGPRPEPDALYCSTCGRYLRDRCAECGAPVDALEARYCVNCGHRLAA
jgi:Double zinc ribbon